MVEQAGPVRLVGRENRLGVRVPAEPPPRIQPPADLHVVVDLPVVDDHGPVLAPHRLRTRLAELDDAEASMGETGRPARKDDGPVAVRPPVGEEAAHRVELAFEPGDGLPPQRNDSRDSAHAWICPSVVRRPLTRAGPLGLPPPAPASRFPSSTRPRSDGRPPPPELRATPPPRPSPGSRCRPGYIDTPMTRPQIPTFTIRHGVKSNGRRPSR